MTINRRAAVPAKVCRSTADQFSLPPDVTPLIDNTDSHRGYLLMDGSNCAWTVEELRRHVHTTLCRHENLVADQFELQVIALTRLGLRCGLQFLLRGPRSVRLGAVWTADQNRVYFYDARGERFLKEPLPHAVAFETQIPAGAGDAA